MTSSFVHLPCEIIDDILDIFLSSQISYSGLSALALVSRRFRRRVQRLRFSEIEVCTRRTPSHRLRSLANLLSSEVWPKHDALDLSIKSFTLLLDASGTSPGIDYAYDPEEDEAIAMILGSIFRANQFIDKYSFSIITNGSFFAHDDSGMLGLPFNNSLGPKVVSAIKDLLHNSYLTELCIYSVWNFPLSLLYTSKITHLRLQNVHFDIHAVEGPYNGTSPPLGHLTHIIVANSRFFMQAKSFADVILKSSIPVKVEKFETWARSNDQLALLSRFGVQPETLTINALDYFYPTPNAVDYSPFQALKCLEFNLNLDIIPRAPDDWDDIDKEAAIWMPKRPAFLNVFNMLPPALPPALHIKTSIRITWLHSSTAALEALDDLYVSLYHVSLLKYIKRNSLAGSHQVQITLEIDIKLELGDLEKGEIGREKKFEAYMMQLLESLTTIDIVFLTVKVNLVDQV